MFGVGGRWQDVLPGRSMDFVRCGLVTTILQPDESACSPRRKPRRGTAFFVRCEDKGQSNLLVTCHENCGWRDRPVELQQGSNWGHARPIFHTVNLTLLEVPKTLWFRRNKSPTVPFLVADQPPAKGDRMIAIGYRQPATDLGSCGELTYPRPLLRRREVWVDDRGGMTVGYKPGLIGSPIFCRGLVVAVALYRDYATGGSTGAMRVAKLKELQTLLQGAAVEVAAATS